MSKGNVQDVKKDVEKLEKDYPKKEKREKMKKYQEKVKSQACRLERYEQDKSKVIEVKNSFIDEHKFFNSLLLEST